LLLPYNFPVSQSLAKNCITFHHGYVTPTLPLAFIAGVLSFLSPCVLPLVPSYLAYVGGSGASGGANAAFFSSWAFRLFLLAWVLQQVC
jgi:cytochrome c biogenesis protein CcdA